MIRLDAVEVHQGRFVLTVDAEIPSGSRVAVMGASGSGKSTLLSLLAGFIWPDVGRLWLDKVNHSQSPVSKRPMSILFQDSNLFPHLTAFENVAVGIDPNLRLQSTDKTRVSEALEKVGLDGFAHRRPADLSGGQQSRVALARVLLQRQPLVLLDEPFAALDPGLRREMLFLVGELCTEQDQTLVMVTHDLRDAKALCENVLLLEDGQVILHDRIEDVEARQDPNLSPWR